MSDIQSSGNLIGAPAGTNESQGVQIGEIVLLRDGSRVVVRPIHSEDIERERRRLASGSGAFGCPCAQSQFDFMGRYGARDQPIRA